MRTFPTLMFCDVADAAFPRIRGNTFSVEQRISPNRSFVGVVFTQTESALPLHLDQIIESRDRHSRAQISCLLLAHFTSCGLPQLVRIDGLPYYCWRNPQAQSYDIATIV